MSITLSFKCGGCFAEAEPVTARAHRESAFGGPLVTVIVKPKIEDLAPEGWVAFDPYTNCTYCPKCWASIESDEPDPPSDALFQAAEDSISDE